MMTLSLNATKIDVATKIMERVSTVLIQKERINIWTNDEKQKNIISQSDRLVLVDSCKEADILIFSKVEDIPKGCNNKLIIVTRYRLLKSYQNAVGAFYWSKGRPQLLFISDQLKVHKISLPDNLKKYSAINL